jgi:HNH endonuclease
MAEISTKLRGIITQRAQQKCEYCRIHQDFSIYIHEIDHIIATKHNGKTGLENLALACLSCNRHKGSDLTSIDPITQKITRLFNPRIDRWADHFCLSTGQIVGTSAIGRTTVFLLRFNTPIAVADRQLLINQGLYV